MECDNNQEELLLDEFQSCTTDKCSADPSQQSLTCSSCKRRIHYKCTLLPLYQLQRFITFGAKFCKYVCSSCTVVDEDLQNILPEWPDRLGLRMAQEEILKQKNLINSYESELDSLRKTVKTMESGDDGTAKKRKRNPEVESTNQNIDDNLVQELNRVIGVRLDQIEDNLTAIIDKKLKQATEDNNNDSGKMTYATAATTGVTSNNNSFRAVMMKTKNEELVEDRDKRLRAGNIIIHGKEEVDNDKNHDEEFVTQLIKDIKVSSINVKSIIRLGKENPTTKKRPLKISLSNEADKEKIMNNLSNLKGEEKYARISIKEDYTISERMLIKEYVNKANQENEKEPINSKFTWKVRGTPKNGLYLKKITKERN